MKPFLRSVIVIPVLLAYVIVAAGAQPSPYPVEPSLVKQLRRAISMAEGGEKEQALVLANALVEEHPDSVPTLKLQGMLLEETGHGVEAAQVYRRALQLTPSDSDLLLKLGTYLLGAGDYDQAIELLLRRLRINPRDGDAVFYLAQAYHLKKEDDLALQTIRECIKMEPGEAHVWQKYGELLCSSGNNEAGLKSLLKAQQLDPKLEQIDFDIGIAHYYRMDFPNAAKYAAKAALRQPKNLKVLALLASAEENLSQWQDAQTAFERILAIEKDDVASLLGLGHCKLERKQYQAAIDALQHLLQIDPSQIEAHYYLSRAYAGLGNTIEAQHQAELHHLMEQLSFAPPELGTEGKEVIWNQARQLLAEHREDEALRVFQESSNGAPATPGDSYVFVGSLYLATGDANDALRTLHRALEIDPTVRGAHTYSGLVALQQGDLDAAEREFAVELANDPNYLPAIAELGEVRYRQQRWADAADLLFRSKTKVASLLYMLCDSYFHLGKMQEAELTVEVLAAYAHNDPETMRGLVDLARRNGESALARRLTVNPDPQSPPLIAPSRSR
jgi:tetratricopeptide (TPR) repeat protein